jgi:hypothetical protein
MAYFYIGTYKLFATHANLSEAPALTRATTKHVATYITIIWSLEIKMTIKSKQSAMELIPNK